jgi:hypothetical protein
MGQEHQLLFMVLQALYFIHPRKPTQVQTAWKISSRTMTLCDESHERRVETRVEALLEAVHKKPPERIRPCDLQKIINSLKLRKSCGIYVIPNECLRHLPRRTLVYLTHLFTLCLRLSHYPKSWKEAKIITLPKPGKDSQFF